MNAARNTRNTHTKTKERTRKGQTKVLSRLVKHARPLPRATCRLYSALSQATIQQMMSTPASQKKLDVLMKHGIITTAPDPSADKASAARQDLCGLPAPSVRWRRGGYRGPPSSCP